MDDRRTLLMGNEAIARGALEGGVSYCTGYAGNPSSEIIGSLLSWREGRHVEVEWSVNEMVALEAAAAFSFSGLRAMVTMKQNGINVCADFLTTVCLNELKGGLLVVVCDDPGPLTSSNEEDSRHFAKIANIPLLEPSTPQEAKDMAQWLLDFSEQHGVPCILRSVSRLSHGRGGVRLGPIPEARPNPSFDTRNPLVGLPFLVTQNHRRLLDKMKQARGEFTHSPFNQYKGPGDARIVIMATGLGALQAAEALSLLELGNTIGILKIGTTWPLPDRLICTHLAHAEQVLFVEEIDPFLEDAVKVVFAEHAFELGAIRFYGKNTGDIGGKNGSGVGEMTTDIVLDALKHCFNIKELPDASRRISEMKVQAELMVPRELAFCSGCSHRASFFAIKAALELDGRNGFVVGDIGCYGLAAGATGYNQIKALHCMGSGMGNASGFSKLGSFNFDQPAIAVVGDSTFFHAGLPALVNAQFNKARALFIILDNSITAMTGFQDNPASPATGAGNPTQPILIENLTKGMGIKTVLLDPVDDIHRAIEAVYEALQEDGVNVIVFRRICATFEIRSKPSENRSCVQVDETLCIGDQCGCNRFCSSVIGCPAIQYDRERDKAVIQEDSCNGCGLCVQMCPREAIVPR